MHLLIDGNLDLACLVVENVAVRRGMQDVDRILEAEYEARRVHRQVRIMAHLFILFGLWLTYY
jgi:CCR4-NOT transcription complex subunit 1